MGLCGNEEENLLFFHKAIPILPPSKARLSMEEEALSSAQESTWMLQP